MYGTHKITHQNPNTMTIYHLHELLLLLLPGPPENSLTHVFWPVLHPSQLLTPHNREYRAPCSCTSHSIHHAQSTPRSRRCSTYSYLRTCRWRYLVIFRTSSSRPFSPELGDPFFRSSRKLPSKRLRDLLYSSPRSAVMVLPDADNIFESCCCLKSLLYTDSLQRVQSQPPRDL